MTDLASMNKHDLAGVVAVVVAIALLLYAWIKVAAKAAKRVPSAASRTTSRLRS